MAKKESINFSLSTRVVTWRDKAKEARNLANTIFAKLCLFNALSLSYRLSFFTPKLVEVNLCEADVAELAVV